MSKEIDYLKGLVEGLISGKGFSCEFISEIMTFPEIDNYHIWLIETLPLLGSKRWIGGSYRTIVEDNILRLRNRRYEDLKTGDKGVYVIGDISGNVIYIGKCDNQTSNLVFRLLDHLVPPRNEECPFGQPANNTPDIWNNFLNKGQKLTCFICYDVNFNPELLEIYLLLSYKKQFNRMPLYNSESARLFSSKPIIDTLIEFIDFVKEVC